MIRSVSRQTGIDLGGSSVKLVHGLTRNGNLEITAFGMEKVKRAGEDPVQDTADALRRLLERLKLSRRDLGDIRVSISGEGASLREVLLPRLGDRDLQRALPYEARVHLDLEGMEEPILSAQNLGHESGERIRVLMAAIPAESRLFALSVLSSLGLEPRVLDLEALASLNECRRLLPDSFPDDRAFAVLDLGEEKCFLHLACALGGLFSRRMEFQDKSDYSSLARHIRESILFYRDRFENDVEALFLAGGGALEENLPTLLEEALNLKVRVLEPSASSNMGPRFVLASGLFRWGGDGV
ncbi:MAG: pilus assembly protein PilM [Candidatus Krumholzibacteria bacterium]|nr:pilus assembly protein PilM [Candidatus Krumholzibacteria bacterium]MDP6668539.1 pilus assembly protein PilM [Candidatus Krumholzibacteria bacterium]MDP6797787.1 pilus assembly protein PilM [Candidatus Krumholzibacteria bacterium]MDP7021420.1 pilus assembly protein PilM [Candidatus Krumholzibacteria bacterium]